MCSLGAKPLPGRWLPSSLVALIADGRFLAEPPAAAPAPERASHLLLLPLAPQFRLSALASGLLPRGSRWLLSSRTYRDEPICAFTVLPRPRKAGMPPREQIHAFAVLRTPGNSSSAILFLSAGTLFLASTLLGMLGELRPVPDHLPPLLASPCLPLPPSSAA